MKKLYKISEISSIFNISRQTLIFYDKINVLKPYFINKENGYRYYSDFQIWDLFFIISLKKAGFSLENIKEYVSIKERERSIVFLEEKIKEIEKKIKDLEESKKNITNSIKDLKNIATEDLTEIRIVENYKIKVFFIKIKNYLNDLEIIKGYDILRGIAKKNGIEEVIYVSIGDLKNIKKREDIPLSKLGILIPKNIEIKGSETLFEKKVYLIKKHSSMVKDIKKTYETLLEDIAEKGEKNCDYSIEIWKENVIVTEEGTGGIMEILLPIEY